MVGDLFAVAASFVAAHFLRDYVLGRALSLLPQVLPLSMVAERFYLLLLYPLVFAYEGLYTKRLERWEEARRCFRGMAVATASLILLLFVLRYVTFSRVTAVMAFAIGVLLVPMVRFGLRGLLVMLGFLRQPVVVLGNGEAARLFQAELTRHRSLGYTVTQHVSRESRSGSVEDLLSQIRELPASVVLAVNSDSFNPEEMKLILRFAEGEHLQLLVIPNTALLRSQVVDMEQVGSALVMKYRDNLLRPLNTVTKRILELVLCSLLFLVSLPVLALLVLMVKLSSRGPVFFVQKRIGRHQRLFRCFKFRTMYVDADARLESLLAASDAARTEWQEYARITDDPRVTGFGRLLRRFSLDELPQLWNVVRGDMALVGPRPYLPRELEQIGGYLGTIVRVRPGMTGLWQVSGRSTLPFRERLVLDEFYIRNWSLWLDFSILLRTAGVVLGGRGAY